jgi:hypothetical protein
MEKSRFVAKTTSNRRASLKRGIKAAGTAMVGVGPLTGGASNLDCANPECSAPFNFRQGRLFRFYRNHPTGNAASMNEYSLKHLWLCKQCADVYRLEYREGTAFLIQLVPSKLFSAGAYLESPLREETSLLQVMKPKKQSLLERNTEE